MSKQDRRSHLMKAILSLLAAALLDAPLVLSAQPRQSDVDRAFASATRLHEAGDIEGAVKGYQAILATHPERADVRSNLGAAYSRLGRYEDAIDQYKLALVHDARNQTIRRNLALAYYKAALFPEAAAELKRLIAAIPPSLPERKDAILMLSDCQVRLGEYKSVIEMLSPMATSDPENRTLAYLLGSALIGDGQVKRGEGLIDRVFRGEDSAEARLLMGTILLLADDGQASIKEIERALELNPKLPSVHAWYGRALMRMGDPERAKDAFRGELSVNQNDFDANLYLGILLKRDRVLDESFGYLARAVHLRPRDSYARYHLGALYAAQGHLDKALPLLEGVAKEFPEFVEARALLANVYYRLKRKPDGDREQAAVQKLNSEQQAKQPGAQEPSARTDLSKPPADLQLVKPPPQ